MSEAKKQCSDDSSCNMFYKSGNSGKYYKCNKGATVKTSRYALSSLQIKGAHLVLSQKLSKLDKIIYNSIPRGISYIEFILHFRQIYSINKEILHLKKVDKLQDANRG